MRLLISLVSIVFLVSCKSDVIPPLPKADFSLDGTDALSTTIGTNDALYPIDHSVNSTSVSWDFGNGTTSNEARPKVTYSSAGIILSPLPPIARMDRRTLSPRV